VRLTGLLRLEHTPIPGGARVRAFFLAEPVDEAPAMPFSDPGAVPVAWVPIAELGQHRLRAPEVEQVLKAVTSGVDIYPLSLLHYEGDQTT
jgi:phosphatase NudJ